MKTKISAEYFERSLKVSPGGVHSPVRAFKGVGGQPLFFKRAEGARIQTVDGEWLYDFCQSFGPNILGHRDSEVGEVVRESLSRAWSLGACEPYSLELAEWICAEIPWVEKIRFVCSGTEAVMSAIRVARGATGRQKILKMTGCYHGHSDGMLVKAGSGLAGESASDSAGVATSVAADTLIVALDDEKSLLEVFASHGSEIAAVIVEPLPANFGLLKQRKEYLQLLSDTSRKHGALVIFDEVISGFRVGLGGMAEKLGIKPDLVTYGKIIGGGFPVGAYAGRADLLDLVAPAGPVYQAGTLAASPIGMMAGLATLKKIKRENIYEKLNQRTEQFVSTIQSGFESNDLPFRVAHEASLFWIYHDASGKREDIRAVEQLSAESTKYFAPLFKNILERGVYLAPSAYEVSFLSWAHSEEILDECAQALIAGLTETWKELHALG